MEKLYKKLEKKFPCRTETIKNYLELIGNPEETFPDVIYVYGHSGTGKTHITKELIHQHKKKNPHIQGVHLNCVEAYTTKILLENILEDFLQNETENAEAGDDDNLRCENLMEFIEKLRKLHYKEPSESSYIIALDNAERLRDMDANVLPTFLRLQEMTGLNICVVLISQLPFEKYHCKSGLSEVLTLYFPQYTKSETLKILSTNLINVKRMLLANLKQYGDNEDMQKEKRQIIENISVDFYNNFLNLFLSVFYKACRDLPELKITSCKLFVVYIEPVLSGSIDISDVSRLWRHIANPLRVALSQVYLRFDHGVNSELGDAVTAPAHSDESQPPPKVSDSCVRKLAQTLELPYYGKYLLIAAFIASHNSPKEDKRLFVKHHGKQRKRMQTVIAKSKVAEKLSTSLGPKSFTIDRLLAIFYAILEDKVGLTCNLLSQISTLVHLKLLSFVSGENNIMEGSARLQCTVGLEFVLQIGKGVGFNVRQYLCDFM